MRMTLKNDNLTSYLGGALFIAVGLGFAYSWKLFNFLSPDFSWGTNNLVFMVFCLIFTFVGVWVFATTKRISVILDKAQQTGFILLQSILNRESKTFNLSELNNISVRVKTEIETYSRKHGGEGTRRYYRYLLEFNLDNKENFYVDMGRIKVGLLTNYNFEYEKKLKDAKQVADFLSVPLVSLNKTTSETQSELEREVESNMEKQQKEWKNRV